MSSLLSMGALELETSDPIIVCSHCHRFACTTAECLQWHMMAKHTLEFDWANGISFPSALYTKHVNSALRTKAERLMCSRTMIMPATNGATMSSVAAIKALDQDEDSYNQWLQGNSSNQSWSKITQPTPTTTTTIAAKKTFPSKSTPTVTTAKRPATQAIVDTTPAGAKKARWKPLHCEHGPLPQCTKFANDQCSLGAQCPRAHPMCPNNPNCQLAASKKCAYDHSNLRRYCGRCQTAKHAKPKPPAVATVKTPVSTTKPKPITPTGPGARVTPGMFNRNAPGPSQGITGIRPAPTAFDRFERNLGVSQSPAGMFSPIVSRVRSPRMMQHLPHRPTGPTGSMFLTPNPGAVRPRVAGMPNSAPGAGLQPTVDGFRVPGPSPRMTPTFNQGPAMMNMQNNNTIIMDKPMIGVGRTPQSAQGYGRPMPNSPMQRPPMAKPIGASLTRYADTGPPISNDLFRMAASGTSRYADPSTSRDSLNRYR